MKEVACPRQALTERRTFHACSWYSREDRRVGTRGNFRVFLPIFLVLCLALPLLLPVSVSAESQPDPRSTVMRIMAPQ